jgi:hypothetical protein
MPPQDRCLGYGGKLIAPKSDECQSQGTGLAIQPGTAHARGQGVAEELLLEGIPAESAMVHGTKR